jgi:hypothetical protein
MVMPRSGSDLSVMRPLEILDGAFGHVHADAAAPRGRTRPRRSRREDQIVDLVGAEHRIGGDAALARLPEDPLGVDTALSEASKYFSSEQPGRRAGAFDF